MEKPILIYQKTAEKVKNKVVIPKICIKKWGYDFYMEIYEDKIILRPIKEK